MLKNLFSFADLRSGFIVFLIALPLSVGIAIASGAPASAGLFAAIVGGIVGSWLGGSEMTINGPAAGLIVVVFGAIESLGQGDLSLGFKYFLAAVIAAGVVQMALGLAKMANVGLAFPGSVIHGMLSAIGAIIIVKQMPVLIGVKPAAKSVFGILLEVPHALTQLNPDSALIGGLSLVLLFGVPKFFPGFARRVPIPLVVVVTGVALGRILDLEHHHTVRFLNWVGEDDPNMLLNVPSRIGDSMVRPDFARFWTMDNLKAVFSITIIASIESVLSTYAVDKLDPKRRVSDLNRDLFSKGACNLLLGLIGGLPIISEIVRSSANIANGAASRFSNFFHGLLILVFLLLFPTTLHTIPLASLAAILISVGWRLSHPSHFQHAWKIGREHFAAFVVTFVVTLATDLLVGVAVGIVTELLIAAYHGVTPMQLFRIQHRREARESDETIEISSPLVFVNILQLRRLLSEPLRARRSVTLHLVEGSFIDHSVMDQIDRMIELYTREGLKLDYRLSEEHQPLSGHPLAARRKRSA